MVTISVVMPVYNTPISFLKEAVDSILNQTVQDFEFIIVDDGSANEIKEYLEGLTDPRIRIIRNETNIGITKSLNIGFKTAHGQYIARMDADDISFPKRFEKQLAFMESNPDVIVCGAKAANLGTGSSLTNVKMESMDSYRVRMLFANPGPTHSTAFFRRQKLNQYRIEYDESLVYAQDYSLWMTISKRGRICILPEVLLYYRVHPDQISKAHREKQIQCDKATQRKLLTELLGNITEEELNLHYTWSTGYFRNSIISHQADLWFDRIAKANQVTKEYDQKELEKRIIHIKKNLIEQTYTPDMPKYEKMFLLFEYLPFLTALKATICAIASKIRKRFKA